MRVQQVINTIYMCEYTTIFATGLIMYPQKSDFVLLHGFFCVGTYVNWYSVSMKYI